MKTRIVLISIAVMIFAAYFAKCNNSSKGNETGQGSDKIIHLNKNNFDQVTKSGVIMIDFWAGWCAPCKRMSPIVEEIANENNKRVKICKINVEQEKELSAKFEIFSIPTFVFLKNGKEVGRTSGMMSKEDLKKIITQLEK